MQRLKYKRPLNASDLNKRITLQKKSNDYHTDEEGNPIEKWEDVATVWAAVKPLRGREFWQAASVNAENTIRVEIRYRKGITNNMRILYGNRLLDINSVIDVEEKHRDMHLMCKEVLDNG
ncbi:phage head closure protein [Bacillus albus]|uniref:phage head closure protein n=1 Tax=Bacillus albus TaxID=2026189 RepID=UPI001F5DDBD1|nr:phage head closure protein [Bacillus albus]